VEREIVRACKMSERNMYDMGEVWGEMSHTRFAVRRSTCYSYSRSLTCAVHGEAGALADGQSLDEVS